MCDAKYYFSCLVLIVFLHVIRDCGTYSIGTAVPNHVLIGPIRFILMAGLYEAKSLHTHNNTRMRYFTISAA